MLHGGKKIHIYIYANISEEYRCKLSQSISKLNATAY